jgi:8-oxo-dGTP pyrophosphatase MutT (NUDIX family)
MPTAERRLMTEHQKPRLAARVILLRPAERGGFEVFLTRRPEAMAFLGGMYGFPGGSMRTEDCSEGMLRRSFGLTPRDARIIVGAHFSPNEVLGVWVTGIRELFEKVGVLLAVNEQGENWISNKHRQTRLEPNRASLLDGSTTFQTILENEALQCDASGLTYFSRWQTPARFSMRFDNCLFLAVLPVGQNPLPSSPEVSHSLWLAPDRALQLVAKDELPMIFPTFASLRTLADFETLASVLKEFRHGK